MAKKGKTLERWQGTMRILLTLDEELIKEVLRSLPIQGSVTINGRLCIRKKARYGSVGQDEWDVDAERMNLAAALEELLPDASHCLLRGD